MTEFERGYKQAYSEWISELSKVMPEDFKDWHQNSDQEKPLIARLVIEGLKELAWDNLEYMTKTACSKPEEVFVAYGDSRSDKVVIADTHEKAQTAYSEYFDEDPHCICAETLYILPHERSEIDRKGFLVCDEYP